MPEPNQVEKIEVDTTKETKGTVRIMGAGFNNPTPSVLARITASLRFTFVSLITMISATDIIAPDQSKWISFGLGIAVLLTTAIDKAVGVEPIDGK